MPNIVGQSLSAAKHVLRAHFRTAGTVKLAFSNTVPTGRVISESPRAGSHLRHGGKVSLTVSEGRKP